MMKLGKLPPKHDPRTLRLARYLSPELPNPPDTVDYTTGVLQWPMYRNDRIGDCTCATAGHMIQSWTKASSGQEKRITEEAVIQAYREVTGYDPEDPSTDRGAYEHDVLRYWRKVGIGGHTIGAWVDVDPKNLLHVKQAIWLFGGLYIGVALPKSAQSQSLWDVVTGSEGTPGSWGGHAINPVRYDRKVVVVPTWGKLQAMTWEFWMKYVDEAHAILTVDWLNPATASCPAGFNLDQLLIDLDHVTV